MWQGLRKFLIKYQKFMEGEGSAATKQAPEKNTKTLKSK